MVVVLIVVAGVVVVAVVVDILPLLMDVTGGSEGDSEGGDGVW